MLFRSKPEGQTVLVLDVEQGSVAAALVRLSRAQKPRLFGEVREPLPLSATHDTQWLAQEALKAAERALAQAALVAARIRQNDTLSHVGDVRQAALFLSAPWGVPDLEKGAPRFIPQMQASLKRAVGDYTGGVPVSFYTGADAAAMSALPLSPALLIVTRGELSELVALEEGPAGYATAPGGLRHALRTLRSHAGLSEAEARAHMLAEHHSEALSAAREHLITHVRSAAALMKPTAARVLVFSDAHAPWLAKGLSENDDFADLFPAESSIETIGVRQLSPRVAAHAEQPDLFLLSEALFVDSKFNRV